MVCLQFEKILKGNDYVVLTRWRTILVTTTRYVTCVIPLSQDMRSVTNISNVGFAIFCTIYKIGLSNIQLEADV